MPRTARALAERLALGHELRAHRLALGYSHADVAYYVRTGKAQVHRVETATQDVLASTLIGIAGAYGLNVVLAAGHHLPLLALTADEVAALVTAAVLDSGTCPNPTLLAALDKLTTTEEPS